jgi:hypothetical protein
MEAKMKKAITLILITIGLIGTVLLINSSEPAVLPRHHRYCIINVIDPSGTTRGKGWPMPTIDFYLKQIEIIENNGGGDLYIYNLSNSTPICLSLYIDPVREELDIYKYSEKEVLRVKNMNDMIKMENEKRKADFLNELDAFILDFVPSDTEDFTYVNNNMLAACEKMDLPFYNSSTCFLLIYSDFVDDTPHSIPTPMDSSIVSLLNKANAQIIICSYTSNEATEHLTGISISSYQDFILLISQPKTK